MLVVIHRPCVMCCLTLAEALKQQGVKVEFICCEHSNAEISDILSPLLLKFRGSKKAKLTRQPIELSGESLFLRKLVLGIPAQASGKKLS
jgi:hypothetical protein